MRSGWWAFASGWAAAFAFHMLASGKPWVAVLDMGCVAISALFYYAGWPDSRKSR